MKQTIIYALDFDGVICDSAVETGITGWKAGAQIWNDYDGAVPADDLIDQFRQIRPLLETGYEAILIIRLLFEGESVEILLNEYALKIQGVIDRFNLNIDSLKQLFGKTRDQWINDNPDDWVAMNPLFSGVADKLKQLNQNSTWYIITTKQERFVKQILSANGVELADECIFGLDRKLSKEVVLTDLINKHPETIIYFIEDRLPTLQNILKNKKLELVRLFFALWGYNTESDKLATQKLSIELINLNNFIE